MKLHHLLQQRFALVRQTRLANVAFVFAELSKFADRIARANLCGQVTLYLADPAAERAWPILVAEEGSQAVIDEHFLDHEILELADLLVFATGHETANAFTFRFEEFGRRFPSVLREELEAAGVELSSETHATDRRATG